MANETDQIELRAEIKFYPEIDPDQEPDANGKVNATGIFRTVSLGMGGPAVLLELTIGENAGRRLAITAGDLDVDELEDVLQLSLLTVQKAREARS